MRKMMLALAFLSLAAMACTLGTLPATSTPAPTATRSAPTATATEAPATATSAPPTASRSDNAGNQDAKLDPCVPPSGWIGYWVQRGDTVNALALRTYSKAADLIRANCLANPNQLTTGQLIYLPRNPLPPTPTNTAVPTSTGCSDALPARLAIGMRGRVTPGNPNSLRTGPDTVGTTVIGQIPGSGQFRVIDGPTCASGLRWWRVDSGGLVGWTPEGQGTTYWLEPL